MPYKIWAPADECVLHAGPAYSLVAAFAYLGEAADWARARTEELKKPHVIVDDACGYIATLESGGRLILCFAETGG